MDKEACIEVGTIQRKQGLGGEVVARLDYEVPQLDEVKTLFVQMNHTLVPYGIEQLSWQSGKAIIKLQGIDDPTAAHHLKGHAIFVLQEALPQLASEEGGLDRLIGYYVKDVAAGSLGVVQDIYTPPLQSLLVIAYEGKELLIPYHSAIVVDINHKQQVIMVELPTGFIEAAF